MAQPFKITSKIHLRDLNPSYHAGLDKDKTKAKTEKMCERIGDLQHLLYANSSHAAILLFQGLDTSGKDGSGKQVLRNVVAAGVETANFKIPTSEELAHDFLWRVHKAAPRYGNIGVFNRSHYEDVLAVRVLKLKPKPVWHARYAQINAFEKMLSENNYIVLKFFLHISKAEQRSRLEARLDDPAKNWKLEKSDLETRARWNQYEEAYEDAINNCSTRHAPWHVVPADHKWYRDHVIARTLIDALESLKMKWPKSSMNLGKIHIH